MSTEENKIVSHNEIIAIKTPQGYLNDVWECWEDEQNYDFTPDPRYAYRFSKVGLFKEFRVPKYLYNWKDDKSINTIEEALEFLDGELVTVEIATEVTWKVKKV